ncbi:MULTISPECIES: hypothetical protein [unclassified Streptomyces]|uniref:hypothetical protein n=1 Tax=unclassified Streptomyces TaxID=2593676 RepID=UPI00081D6E4C|nr:MULTISPECIES: hypothetical protein [unclassified Streptomyces]MYZ41081.1 hypothetical protein [Streptomyces sp. SID4917]SCG09383.1 hypothetical protein GA0115259_115272 [Streptomyces sp. MnatMP-M17]
MTEQDVPASRLAGQPAPRPLGPTPAPLERRLSFDELMQQAGQVDYGPIAEHLDDDARTALGLPARPHPVQVDRGLADRARDYFLTRPDQAAALPAGVRDLLAL